MNLASFHKHSPPTARKSEPYNPRTEREKQLKLKCLLVRRVHNSGRSRLARWSTFAADMLPCFAQCQISIVVRIRPLGLEMTSLFCFLDCRAWMLLEILTCQLPVLSAPIRMGRFRLGSLPGLVLDSLLRSCSPNLNTMRCH